MKSVLPFFSVLLLLAFNSQSSAQTLTFRPEKPVSPTRAAPQPDSIPLIVPAGTPLKVALDQEVRIREVGQPVHGKLTEPVYAFDKLVVPTGTEVTGRIAEIKGLSKKQRTLAAMNADFSPSRDVRIEFDNLLLEDGRHMRLQTAVSLASPGVLQFAPASGQEKQGIEVRGKRAAKGKISQVRQLIKRDWDMTKAQTHEPGKAHRVERYAVDRLPYHPQYLDAGASFNADLEKPLDFGSEPLNPQSLTDIGTPPPLGSMVHAVLVTPLDSASSTKGDPVEAVITQPLVVSDHLFLPEGSRIEGSVLQVRPAGRFKRNGQLRVVFHQVAPPSGIERKVEASLEAVAVAKGEHLKLDSEGGAEVTTPRTRYLTTAFSVVLATSGVGGDSDGALHGGGDAGRGAVNGASGFRLVGALVGAFAHSRVVTSGFGFYGAGMSVYSHFLARGRDVIYPKDMSMIVGLGTRAKPGAPGSTTPR